jgi:ubiquinone/menaquinone biosynthesis C-methylase UbiE
MQNVGTGGTQFIDPEQILKEELRLDFGAKVADLGCGSMAYFTIASAKIVGNDGIVYAVDIQKEVLSSVESKAKLEGLLNIRTVWSNLELVGATKVPEEMDYVFLNTVLFQNSEHLKLFKEAVRLLKKGSKLMVVEWLPQNTAIGPAVEKRLSAEMVKQYASEMALEVEKEFTAGPYHYGLIFVK